VVFLVRRTHWHENDGMLWEEKLRIVDAPDATYPPLILRYSTCRTLQEGRHAAVVASELTDDEKTYLVLDRAFVVSVSSPALEAGR
jgi:hypothetical protein